jgi:hypothetical protein
VNVANGMDAKPLARFDVLTPSHGIGNIPWLKSATKRF